MRKVLIGGVFDILHNGHIKAFETARSFGDYLVVQVASDLEARGKGPGRPIQTGKERVEHVRGIRYVDEVVYSEEIMQWPQLLDSVQPDVVISNLRNWNEMLEEECQKRRIILVKIPRYDFDSTTKLIEKINARTN